MNTPFESASLENTFQKTEGIVERPEPVVGGGEPTEHRPGPGPSRGGPKGPRPHRREVLNVQNPGAIVTPGLDSTLQNQNRNVAPGQ